MEGGGGFESYIEKSPEELRQEALEEIGRLLAKIIETGPDLDPQYLQSLRNQVQDNLTILGLKGIDDPLLLEVMSKVHQEGLTIPIPQDYPTPSEFRGQYELVVKRQMEESDTECTQNPSLKEIIDFTTINFGEIKPRGQETLEQYLYDLGKVISNWRGYATVFKDDPIKIGKDWSVQNGRHRVATLKCLGDEYLQKSGVENWVKSELEK